MTTVNNKKKINVKRSSLWTFRGNLRLWDAEKQQSWYFNNDNWHLSYWESPTGGHRYCRFVSYL